MIFKKQNSNQILNNSFNFIHYLIEFDQQSLNHNNKNNNGGSNNLIFLNIIIKLLTNKNVSQNNPQFCCLCYEFLSQLFINDSTKKVINNYFKMYKINNKNVIIKLIKQTLFEKNDNLNSKKDSSKDIFDNSVRYFLIQKQWLFKIVNSIITLEYNNNDNYLNNILQLLFFPKNNQNDINNINININNNNGNDKYNENDNGVNINTRNKKRKEKKKKKLKSRAQTQYFKKPKSTQNIFNNLTNNNTNGNTNKSENKFDLFNQDLKIINDNNEFEEIDDSDYNSSSNSNSESDSEFKSELESESESENDLDFLLQKKKEKEFFTSINKNPIKLIEELKICTVLDEINISKFETNYFEEIELKIQKINQKYFQLNLKEFLIKENEHSLPKFNIPYFQSILINLNEKILMNLIQNNKKNYRKIKIYKKAIRTLFNNVLLHNRYYLLLESKINFFLNWKELIENIILNVIERINKNKLIINKNKQIINNDGGVNYKQTSWNLIVITLTISILKKFIDNPDLTIITFKISEIILLFFDQIKTQLLNIINQIKNSKRINKSIKQQISWISTELFSSILQAILRSILFENSSFLIRNNLYLCFLHYLEIIELLKELKPIFLESHNKILKRSMSSYHNFGKKLSNSISHSNPMISGMGTPNFNKTKNQPTKIVSIESLEREATELFFRFGNSIIEILIQDVIDPKNYYVSKKTAILTLEILFRGEYVNFSTEKILNNWMDYLNQLNYIKQLFFSLNSLNTNLISKMSKSINQNSIKLFQSKIDLLIAISNSPKRAKYLLDNEIFWFISQINLKCLLTNNNSNSDYSEHLYSNNRTKNGNSYVNSNRNSNKNLIIEEEKKKTYQIITLSLLKFILSLCSSLPNDITLFQQIAEFVNSKTRIILSILSSYELNKNQKNSNANKSIILIQIYCITGIFRFLTKFKECFEQINRLDTIFNYCLIFLEKLDTPIGKNIGQTDTLEQMKNSIIANLISIFRNSVISSIELKNYKLFFTPQAKYLNRNGNKYAGSLNNCVQISFLYIFIENTNNKILQSYQKLPKNRNSDPTFQLLLLINENAIELLMNHIKLYFKLNLTNNLFTSSEIIRIKKIFVELSKIEQFKKNFQQHQLFIRSNIKSILKFFKRFTNN
ncbi:ring finger protein 41-like [Anaeramoeba flamelloides]|uniref:Ring finger protein 41-like n=1 Tax=Anaeramoeba flamelloides TaxID=1746091 RepID=A0AAV7YBW6_9EUKA|nr:ring finger protein 41-like [Anaeramoeba flamelloides]